MGKKAGRVRLAYFSSYSMFLIVALEHGQVAMHCEVILGSEVEPCHAKTGLKTLLAIVPKEVLLYRFSVDILFL